MIEAKPLYLDGYPAYDHPCLDTESGYAVNYSAVPFCMSYAMCYGQIAFDTETCSNDRITQCVYVYFHI